MGSEMCIRDRTCIIVDKIDKLSPEVIDEQLAELGHDSKVISTIQSTLGLKHLNSLKKVLKPDSAALSELTQLFEAIDAYGISNWVEFDASIVRGLASIQLQFSRLMIVKESLGQYAVVEDMINCCQLWVVKIYLQQDLVLVTW